MSVTAPERVEVMVMSGPREGEVLLLPSDVVSEAPGLASEAGLEQLGAALDQLSEVLERFTDRVRESAASYSAAADRLERLD